MNIGRNIRTFRQQKGVTQEQLAAHLGLSYQAVSKWETNANTPDIALLPEIAQFFGTSIDALFSGEITNVSLDSELIKDDDVFRIVQMRGKKLVQVDVRPSAGCPPIEIAFPRNCNHETQYFKVEVYGHIVADASINGDVTCHQTIRCADINGDVRCDGEIYANSISTTADIICNQINGCYQLRCHTVKCSGDIISSNLTAAEIEKKDV